MTIGVIGQKQGNIVVPVNNLMRRTKDISVTFSSTPAGWSETLNRCVFYADSVGKWRMVFNISGTFNSTSNPSFTISGVTFDANGTRQPISSYFFGTVAYAVANTGTLETSNISGITSMQLSGDVALDSEPTTYTTSANMENVADIAAYIPFGQTGMPGEMFGTERASTTVGSSYSIRSTTDPTTTPAALCSITLDRGIYLVSGRCNTYFNAQTSMRLDIAINGVAVTSVGIYGHYGPNNYGTYSISGVPIHIKVDGQSVSLWGNTISDVGANATNNEMYVVRLAPA